MEFITESVIVDLLKETFPNPDFINEIYVESKDHDFVHSDTYCVIHLKSWYGIDIDFIREFRKNMFGHGYQVYNIYIDPNRYDNFESFLSVAFNIYSL